MTSAHASAATPNYRICYSRWVDEWDIYQTDEVAAWLRELQDSDPKTADLVNDAIYTLSRSGPRWGARSSTPLLTRRSAT